MPTAERPDAVQTIVKLPRHIHIDAKIASARAEQHLVQWMLDTIALRLYGSMRPPQSTTREETPHAAGV